MPYIRRAIAVTIAVVASLAVPAPASAYSVTFGAVAGQNLSQCDDNTLPASDDGAITVALGTTLKMGALSFSSVTVSNNGQVAPGAPGFNIEPDYDSITYPTFAVFGADVQTSFSGDGTVTYGIGADGTFCAVWDDVRSQAEYPSFKRNTFQLLLSPAGAKPGRVQGDFDLTYNYDKISWDYLGYASAGYTDGTGPTGLHSVIAGSWQTPAAANPGALIDGGPNALIAGSNNSTQAGRYLYRFTNPAGPTATGNLIPALPTVSGTPALGSSLTVDPHTWGPAPVTLSYLWFRDGAHVPAVTGTTYPITEDDLGHSVSVHVVGSKQYYYSTEVYGPTTAVPLAAASVTSPAISGTATVGSVLTASASVSPVTAAVSYQWLRSGAPILGATASTYTVTEADAALPVSVQISASRAGYVTATATSSAVAIAALPVVVTNTPAPTASPTPTATPTSPPPATALLVLRSPTTKITGTAKVGKKLTVKRGTWTPGTTFRYQWYANGKAIKKATKSTLKLATSVKGKKITVKVTGTKTGYITASVMSKATKKVAAR